MTVSESFVRRARVQTRLAAAIFAFVSSAGCGSAAPAVQPTTPFTAEHREVFEDGADFIADPDDLEGRWREDWSRDLDRRVSWSDFIGLVRIHTVRTDVDPGRVETYRLLAEIDESLWGGARKDELVLAAREGESGHATLASNDRRLLGQRFVLFVKWYQDASGEVKPHWHLSPASEPVVDRVRYLIENRLVAPDDRAEQRTVVYD